jgi:hypothetical protein
VLRARRAMLVLLVRSVRLDLKVLPALRVRKATLVRRVRSV